MLYLFTIIFLLYSVAPRFDKELADCSLVEGKDVKFEARCYAVPIPDIMWLKDNKPFTQSERIKTTQKDNILHILQISKALSADAGVYTIVASNVAGEAKTNGKLDVQGDYNHTFICKKCDGVLLDSWFA